MLLSVVVTIVDGGDALTRCLDALGSQQGGPALEVIVPFDDSVPEMAAFAARYPSFVLLDMGHVETASRPLSPAGQHELFDRRRAAGLARAGGDLVAILEDRGVPRVNWAAEAERLHRESDSAVIGGAIENGNDHLLNWAVYFCDFGRYQLPFPAGPRAFVSDANICYKRRAMDATRHLWQERYHEPVVHDELVRLGETLMISPELIVDENRGPLRLSPLVGERVAWGRLFASLRVRSASLGTRYTLAALTPFLPFLLWARLARMQIVKGLSLTRFIAATPAVLVLLGAWSVGELLGYLTGRR